MNDGFEKFGYLENANIVHQRGVRDDTMSVLRNGCSSRLLPCLVVTPDVPQDAAGFAGSSRS
jgi:hypothetical protein